MNKLLLFSLFWHFASPVKHSLQLFVTASSGIPNLPQFVGVAVVDDTVVGYYDSNIRRVELKLDWTKKFIKDDPHHLEYYTNECLKNWHILRVSIDGLKQRLNKTGDVHVLQRMNSCEWNDETGDITGYNQFGYDGEDFLSLDLQTLTWTAPKPQALTTKLSWDTDKDRLEYNKNYYINTCPNFLKKYVFFGRIFLQRTDVPSLSLLQKTPSSPVSCHATGFYPDRAMMFWRKDGEEIHEGVEHGEILPNHDGSFQMNVDLDISSVSPEDWRRYDCVFHLSSVEDDIITKLDETQIRTNWAEKPRDKTITIIIIIISAVVVVVVVIFAAAAGFMVHRKKQDQKAPPDTEDNSELSSET
ncbi:major histocompatibility complex class I-related gene protein-like [Mugil cephalus]|uniref:major histocompatibility complex class I-related gene protein-like n=1 Tax=Mugil cephalus TaxID=48193 RepID=UPI001FB59421|nr:major histocompatibility complex class I-related gene protein-like [Mugil cephalus]